MPPVNINTLGVTYGSAINGTTLSGIINSFDYTSDYIYVNGNVIFNTANLVIDNDEVDIRGDGTSGRFSASPTSLEFQIKQFSNIQDLIALPVVRFPADSTANGNLHDIDDITTFGITFSTNNYSVTTVPKTNVITKPNCTGLRIDNIGGNPRIWGPVDGVTFKNMALTGTSTIKPIVVCGSNNIFEYLTIDGNGGSTALKLFQFWGVGPQENCVFRYNTTSGAVEEAVGYDSYGYDYRLLGQITAINSNTITVTSLDSHLENPYLSDWGEPLTGTNSVGFYVAIVSGSGIGKYFKVSSQSDDELTLDTTNFDVSGLAQNDRILITAPAVNLQIYDNDIEIDQLSYNPTGHGQHIGISVYSNNYGPQIYNNTIENTSHDPTLSTQSFGIHIGSGVALYETAEEDIYGVYFVVFHANCHDNTVINCLLDIWLTSFYWNMTYYITETGWYEGLGKMATADYPVYQSGTIVKDNLGEGTYNGVYDALNVTWEGNVMVTPSIEYDWIHIIYTFAQYGAGQTPLGGDTDTTYTSYILFEDTNELTNIILKDYSGSSLVGTIKNYSGDIIY